MEKIIKAAIKLSNGNIYTGKRHHLCIREAVEAGNETPLNCKQGFLTNTYRFVSRQEAAIIAYEAKQTVTNKGILYSEDLYLE